MDVQSFIPAKYIQIWYSLIGFDMFWIQPWGGRCFDMFWMFLTSMIRVRRLAWAMLSLLSHPHYIIGCSWADWLLPWSAGTTREHRPYTHTLPSDAVSTTSCPSVHYKPFCIFFHLSRIALYSAFDLWPSTMPKSLMHPFLCSVPSWLMLLLSITQTNSDWNTFCRRARTKYTFKKRTSQIWTASKNMSSCVLYTKSVVIHFEPSNLPLRLAPPFQLVGSPGRCAHPRDFQLLCLRWRILRIFLGSL